MHAWRMAYVDNSFICGHQWRELAVVAAPRALHRPRLISRRMKAADGYLDASSLASTASCPNATADRNRHIIHSS
jgi:hypothetical protein